MDPLSDILQSLRLASSVLSRAEMSEPYAVKTRGFPGLIFHAVSEGACWLSIVDGPRYRLSRGDIAVLTRGDPHVIASDTSLEASPIAELPVDELTGGVPTLKCLGGGESTTLICGTFRMDHVAVETLLPLLPRLMHVKATGGGVVDWLDATVQMIASELAKGRSGADAVITRLTDVLFIHALRAHAEANPEGPSGWLAASRHPQIGRALALIHEEPAAACSAEWLAESVGMSRSSFFSKFNELVGEPPAQYVARWRMFTAADLLRRSDVAVAVLAEKVGYRSPDAFTKAFKRQLGLSPTQYRRQGNRVQ